MVGIDYINHSNIVLLDIVLLLRKYWAEIRPTSTESESGTSIDENEIKGLQSSNRRLKYNQILMKLKNAAEQLKNEKMKNEKLEQENQAINNEMGGMNCKFKFCTPILMTLIAFMIANIIWQVHENHQYKNYLQEKQKKLLAFEEQLNRLEIENQGLELGRDNQRLEIVKQSCENELKDIQTKLQSRDRENQKCKDDLQEKQKELQASGFQLNIDKSQLNIDNKSSLKSLISDVRIRTA